jgi:methionine sulfoxide reductase heme-binding subunit
VDETLWWFLNRGSGLVALTMLTLSTVLGVLSARGRAGRRIPTFVTQAVHRNVSLLALLWMATHTAAAVVHDFVDIRWWEAFVPFAGSYEPVWVGLGAIVLDLTLVLALTSLLRDRIDHRLWLGIHVTSYASWVLAIVHTIGIGTDIKGREDWAVGLALGCVVLFVTAVIVRLSQLRGQSRGGAMRGRVMR